MTLSLTKTHAGSILPLLPKISIAIPCHYRLESNYQNPIPVGTTLLADTYKLSVVGHMLYPAHYALPAPLLKADSDIPNDIPNVHVRLEKKGYSLAWITLSDKGSQGLREDTSGPCIEAMLREHLPLCHSQGFILPDDKNALKLLLLECALRDQYDILITTGGTGLTERDITPDVTEEILDKTIPGITQAMMAHSLSITPNAVLSRACAGIVGKSLLINLPGSKKAVQENLQVILRSFKHILAKLHNDPSDCGG